MDVEIRPARAEEAAAIVPCFDWLFASPGATVPGWDPGHAAAAVGAAIEAPGSDVLVAVLDRRVVGFATCYRDLTSIRFGPRAWVEDLAVDPAARSQRVGARLLTAALAWARAHGASHLSLISGEARRDAHRFYEREGGGARSVCFRWDL